MRRIFSKKEVINILVAEYDYDTDIAVQRAEAGRIAFVEGREQGITQGISQGKARNCKVIKTAWRFCTKDNAGYRIKQIGCRRSLKAKLSIFYKTLYYTFFQ